MWCARARRRRKKENTRFAGGYPPTTPRGSRPINPGKGEIRRFLATPEMVIENRALGSQNFRFLESLCQLGFSAFRGLA